MDSHAVLRLTWTDSGGSSTELSTINPSESTIIIGRGNEVDICFGEDDQSVSRRQFEVSFQSGRPRLKNAGRNPVVYKNGKKQLSPGAEMDIASGLEVRFRQSKLRFDVVVPEVYCLKSKGVGGRASFEMESNRKYTVGRSPDCDITLDSSGISRRHCRMQIEPDGILKIHDLGSVNGVRLFVEGEVQTVCPDLEVPSGAKFIVGDIECILDRKRQGAGKKKLIGLLVVLLISLVAVLSYFGLKPGSSLFPDDPKSVHPLSLGSSGNYASSLGSEGGDGAKIPRQPSSKIDSDRQQNIARIQAIIQDDASFGKKAEWFAGLAKKSKSGSLVPVCNQLAEYYSRCDTLEKMNDSVSKEYQKRKQETKSSFERMSFDFDPSLSVQRLEDESEKLKAAYEAVTISVQEHGIAAPSFPLDLTEVAIQLASKADEYEEKARSLSFIWTDLMNSSFDASKFDKKEMMASIETLYPGEGIGVGVCAEIDEIINYRQQMSEAYQGLVGQVGVVLSNCTVNGVSERLQPERLAMKPLRETLGTPLPGFYEEPPPVAVVSRLLYSRLEAISADWSNLDLLTYCGSWKSDLEEKESVFPGVREVVPLLDQLCREASLKCVVDLNKGLDPCREIKGRLESGEMLGFHDADKLIRVYNHCYPYLQHDLFCTLQGKGKKEAEIESADCLKGLFDRLTKDCEDGSMALDAAEKAISVANAKKVLKVLDSAVYLEPAFVEKIKDYRKWVNDSDLENVK
jgi:hypothetical protein